MKKRPMRRKYERKKEAKLFIPKGKPQRIQVKDDWLKYLRVARYWFKRQYGLSYPDLELMLFLYSEGIFKRSDFDEFCATMPWNKKRFQSLVTSGHIVLFRPYSKGKASLYELSASSKVMVRSVYKKLKGEQTMSEMPKKNPMYNKKVSYTDKVYRGLMSEVNKKIREQQQHHGQE